MSEIIVFLLGKDYTVEDLKKFMRDHSIIGLSGSTKQSLEDSIVKHINEKLEENNDSNLEISIEEKSKIFQSIAASEKRRMEIISQKIAIEKYTVADLKNYMRVHKISGISGRKHELEEIIINYDPSAPPISPYVDSKIKPSRKAIPSAIRIKIWDMYIGPDKRMGPCFTCKKTIDITNFHAGHIVADAHGGSQDVTNLRPVCNTCNISMGTTNMIEFQKMFEKLEISSKPVGHSVQHPVDEHSFEKSFWERLKFWHQ